MIILVMSNLNAFIDSIYLPSFHYLIEEELNIAGFTALLISASLGSLQIYIPQLQRIFIKQEESKLVVLKKEKLNRIGTEKIQDSFSTTNYNNKIEFVHSSSSNQLSQYPEVISETQLKFMSPIVSTFCGAFI